jgi:hypothetical protein
MLAGIVVILGLIVSHPFETISALTLVYAALVPVAVQRYMRRAASPDGRSGADPANAA